MDQFRFDRLVRSVAGLTSRRGVLGLAASLPVLGAGLAVLDPDDAAGRHKRKRADRQDDVDNEGKRKRKRRRRRNRRKGQDTPPPCVPDAKTTTCNQQCGNVTNNCGDVVDCGSCACGQDCGVCQTCDETTGACVPEAAGTPCGPPPFCDSGLAIFQDTCDGAGSCVPGGGELCRPYACAEGVCLTTCASDTDCEPGNYCDDQDACVPKSSNGQPCAANNECFSDLCCENFCRACCDNSDCDPSTPLCLSNVCETCAVSPVACPEGTCCNGTNGMCVADCPGTQLCAANNVCTPPCESHDDCAANQLCVAGICRDCDAFPNPFVTIQSVINDAEPGSTLYVCPGFYGPDPSENAILIDKTLTIIGAGDGAGETRLQGQVHIDGAGTAEQPVILRDLRIISSIRGVWLQGGNLRMERCTVRGGSSQGIGVDNAGGALEMRRCAIVDIRTNTDGGGLRNTNGSAILRNCRIEDNTAARGAGIWTGNAPAESSSLTLFNTEVRGNTANAQDAATGAGILNFDGTSTVTISSDSFICDNDPDASQCDGLLDTSRCFTTCPD